MMIVTNENGVEKRHDPTPDGMEVIDHYHPHSCPWDYYGAKHVSEFRRVLSAAGINSQALYTHRRRLAPMGSGPKGMIRFGDDMMPSDYRIAVAVADVAAANAAIAAHNEAIRVWLHENGTMPEACCS